ncbi:hypothetical protein BKP37_10785 [Anaerobacillus alkalilacustris]|uniref:Nuclease SbcCD subunit C n=1 Tax=Anaerobacillus alkalilacustris TaxID=393763 RepID=A0A1S2LLP7_9BACI|nr:SMC family ATPase [Anaerobacillus alkalilacustris]OIJ13448.1 hypothetical protein BKP37_10785 [Anaerobacillus alkalilacustris]
MKPLKLTMQAFGPYANKQEVDFTKLGQKTMFVVSGATGAGKTTIFDGISFAIYGKASGDDRIGNDLRSQFAQDTTLTEVSLLFELRGKQYLIVRSPQQEKKKTRGEGTTTQGAKAELFEIGETEVLLASNVREVDEKINEIMKIDCQQFRQIMMIPQGEFRKLLVSDSKDKEKILQKLFHTENYKNIEEKLKDTANQLKKQVDKSILERKTFISRIQGEGNEKLKELMNADFVNVAELLEELTKLVKEDETSLQAQAVTIATKEDHRQLVQKEIHQAKELIEQLETKEKLFLQKEQLEAQLPTIEKQVEAIQLANRAMILQQYEQQCIEVDRQVLAKQQELNTAEGLNQSLKSILNEKQEILQLEEQKASEREACQKEISRLQNLENEVLSFSTLEKEVKKLSASIEKTKANKISFDHKLTILEEKLQTVNKEKEAIHEAKLQQADISMKLANEQRMLEKVSELLKNKRQLITLEKLYTQSEDDRDDIEEDLSEKNDQLEEILQAWSKGQAGILAKQLKNEDPCPVCGSQHHPNMALMPEGMPTEEKMKKIQKEVKELEHKKQQIDAAYYEAKSKFETHMDRVIALADEVNELLPYQLRSLYALEELEEHFQSQCKNMAQELKNLEETVKRTEKLEEELQALTAEKTHLSDLLRKTNEEHELNYTTFVEKRRDLTRLSETLPENMRDEAAYRDTLIAVEEKLKSMKRTLRIAEQSVNNTIQKIASNEGSISSLQKVVTELLSRQTNLHDAFKNKLDKLGFLSVEHYRQVKIPEFEIKKLEANVQAYREELRSVTDRYQDLVLRLETAQKPNMEKLNEKLQLICDEIEQLQARRNSLYHKVKTNIGIHEAIVNINSQMAESEEKYKTVGELADIASGRNTYRVTFERYVLAAFLDQILLAANGRLNKMTNGRYQLQRKTERSKGNAQSGLELLAFDQYTGSSRHVKTLSGGESFKASLSLALGLADIVQSYAGGVSMETMFIDEGFGTLDPESLENAIETLIEIQSTGRLVGVISHVPELKERIDARFEVTASQAGSSVKYYGNTISM